MNHLGKFVKDSITSISRKIPSKVSLLEYTKLSGKLNFSLLFALIPKYFGLMMKYLRGKAKAASEASYIEEILCFMKDVPQISSGNVSNPSPLHEKSLGEEKRYLWKIKGLTRVYETSHLFSSYLILKLLLFTILSIFSPKKVQMPLIWPAHQNFPFLQKINILHF